MYMYIYEQRTKLFVKRNAMHKLGSSPIGSEDFSILGYIASTSMS